MNRKTLAFLCAAASAAIAAPAVANTTIVTCPGYAISMTDDIAIQGQVRAGSVAAFERVVCERSSDAAKLSGDPQIVPVFIEELGVSTRVVVFPVGDN